MPSRSEDRSSTADTSPAPTADRPHDATLRYAYDDSATATIVARSVRQEVGEIGSDRSATTVERDGAVVVIRVGADDLVALRAGLNTWQSLVGVAERTAGFPGQ